MLLRRGHHTLKYDRLRSAVWLVSGTLLTGITIAAALSLLYAWIVSSVPEP